ncbi:MAG: DMT family transporter [Rhodospirillales bacterium]
MDRSRLVGMASASVSALLGGSAVAFTRLAVHDVDPLAVATIRYGICALCLLPLLFVLRLPRGRRNWPMIALLALVFFVLFPLLFTQALVHTTAARGGLALATMPIQTMLLAAALRVERLTPRKLLGVALAFAGVTLALWQSLGAAVPDQAWRGDLLMAATGFFGACFNVAARVYLQRVPALLFTAGGSLLGAGVLALALIAAGGGLLPAAPPATWWALVYLGVFGGALTFVLWNHALARTSPTRVAVAVGLNPVSAMLLGAVFLDEPITPALVADLAAVLTGIALVSLPGRKTV